MARVSFGFGTVLYFAAEQEPALWASLALAVGTIVAAVLVRHRPIGFPLMVGVAAIAAALRPQPSSALSSTSGAAGCRLERGRDGPLSRVRRGAPSAPTALVVRVHHSEGPG